MLWSRSMISKEFKTVKWMAREMGRELCGCRGSTTQKHRRCHGVCFRPAKSCLPPKEEKINETLWHILQFLKRKVCSVSVKYLWCYQSIVEKSKISGNLWNRKAIMVQSTYTHFFTLRLNKVSSLFLLFYQTARATSLRGGLVDITIEWTNTVPGKRCW